MTGDPTGERERLRAVSAFLLEREPLLVPLASQLQGGDAVFESAIRGSSMAPAIPGRSRIRVRLGSGHSCRRGEVVYYRVADGYMVHRVVHRGRRSPAASYLLTLGDGRLAPDPPVRVDDVLGTVVAVEDAGRWREPGPPRPGSVYHRMIRTITLAVTLVAFAIDAAAARRVAGAFSRLESATRGPVGRLLRRAHLTASRR